MKRISPILVILLTASVAYSLWLVGVTPYEALKRSDLIVIGVATSMAVVEYPNVPKDRPGVRSHGRLAVRLKRVVIPADAKVADTVDVDYGYNPGDHSWKGYKDKELVYILSAKEKDANGVITRAQALRFWGFAYRLEDLDRVLELRSRLLEGADPKSLTNDIPQEVFSAH